MIRISLIKSFHQFLPPFVVIFREGIFERNDGVFLDPPDVQFDHLIGAQNLRILSSPEQVLTNRLLFSGLFTICIAELTGSGIEREANIPIRNKAALLDGLYRHPQCPFFGEKVASLPWRRKRRCHPPNQCRRN